MADVRDLMQGSMPDNSAMNPMGSQGMSYGSPMQSQPMPQESVLGGMAQPSQPQSNIPMASAPAQGMPVEPQTMPEPQQPMQSQVQQPPPTVSTFLDNLENITDKLFRNPFDSSEYLLLDDEGAPKVKVSLSTLGVPQDTIKVSSVQALGEGREGYGTQLMKLLVQAAESSGMKLQLTADPNLKYPHPSGVQKGLNKEQLIDWYTKIGFQGGVPGFENDKDILHYDPATMDPPSEMDQEFKKFSSAEDYAWSQKKKEREFRDAHAAPSAEDTPPEQRLEEGGDFSLAEIKQGFMNVPKDFFDPQTGPKNYMYNTSLGKESLRVIREYLDGKKDTLTAYRTVPKDLKEDNFIDGDWITFNKQYATNHGESRFGENEYRIIEQEVDPKDVWWDGNDINEWGYDTNANWQNFIDTWNQAQPEQSTPTIEDIMQTNSEVTKKTIENSKKLINKDKNIELVPVDELLKYRQFDRSVRPSGLRNAKEIDKLRKDIARDGITEEVIINYGAKDRIATLGEGNHRLMIAKELGIEYIPARVHGTQSKIDSLEAEKQGYGKVTGREPDQFGYVPSDQKPSDIGIKSVKIIKEEK